MSTDVDFEALKAELGPMGYFGLVQDEKTGKVYGLQRFVFTIGLVVDLTPDGYDHRYCYESLYGAVPALRDWQARGFEGIPSHFIKRKPELPCTSSEPGGVPTADDKPISP